jgi:S1-C subfamily serine protease
MQPAIEVVLNDKRCSRRRVIGTDPSTTLAVIRIDEKGLPTSCTAYSDEHMIGEWDAGCRESV